MRHAVVLLLVASCFGRTHKLFPATHDSIPAENRRADMLNLKRYETLSDVKEGVMRGDLVPLTISVSPKLPKERRYALPGTVAFAEKLDQDFYDATSHHLVIDSAIRPSDVQKRLRRRNRNAAPAQGARASSHERGTTFDLSRRMTRGEYRWLLVRLAYYKARGAILVIEERACLHIFVGGDDAPILLDRDRGPVDLGNLGAEDMSYLTFIDCGIPEDRKTHRYEVCSGLQTLGQIRFYGAWRKFCFFPNEHTVFDSGCLDEIADFCRQQTALWRG